MSGKEIGHAFMTATNMVLFSAWANVVYAFTTLDLTDRERDTCERNLRPALYFALAVSMIELVTCVIGWTRSNPIHVLVFASVRAGVEIFVTPLVGCSSWQHLLTAFCWSLGDAIRFGCFTVDGLFPGGSLAKSIRYTIGPIFFSVGTLAEMLMVTRAAMNGRTLLYLAAALWPIGFFPLMRQLLYQRRKHFAPKQKPEIKSV
jgi:Protein tyrosine phosphatase-like protein, PTPLA